MVFYVGLSSARIENGKMSFLGRPRGQKIGLIFLLCGLFLLGCGTSEDGEQSSADGDADADNDADADTDTDTDSDTDGDGDSDSDSDSDSDGDGDTDSDADSDGDSDADGDSDGGACAYECSEHCRSLGGSVMSGSCEDGLQCCDIGDADADSDGDSDADGDTDTDTDTDADSDGDSDGDTDSDSDSDSDAAFDIEISLSSVIGTVGIVEWSIDKSIDSAVIDFGRNPDDFEYQAPVDLNNDNYRTLLLGMKPNQIEYFVRITAYDGDTAYRSEVKTITTDFIRSGLPNVTITTDANPDALFGGFTVLCTGATSAGGGGFGGDLGGGSESWVLIIDKDAEIVWWYELTDTPVAAASRARMSYDGKDMWVGNFANFSDATPTGVLFRVSMDGLDSESYSFPERHHDFGILPNNHILFYERASGYDLSDGPDVIKDLDPETGATSVIYEEYDYFASAIDEANGTHTNYITYVPHMNAILFSMAFPKTISVISDEDTPEVLGVFGGDMSWFDNIIFDNTYVHGVHILEDSILFFANTGNNGGSSIFEFSYDLETRTASQIWEYSSGKSSAYFGDVRRLPNGNTFVTYCAAGTIHEVDESGNLLREITTDAIGYTEHRKTLYGAPPPWDN